MKLKKIDITDDLCGLEIKLDYISNMDRHTSERFYRETKESAVVFYINDEKYEIDVYIHASVTGRNLEDSFDEKHRSMILIEFYIYKDGVELKDIDIDCNENNVLNNLKLD